MVGWWNSLNTQQQRISREEIHIYLIKMRDFILLVNSIVYNKGRVCIYKILLIEEVACCKSFPDLVCDNEK